MNKPRVTLVNKIPTCSDCGYQHYAFEPHAFAWWSDPRFSFDSKTHLRG